LPFSSLSTIIRGMINSTNRKALANLGQMMMDVSKLALASFVFGIIIRGEINQIAIVIVGIVLTIVFAFLGILLVSKFRE